MQGGDVITSLRCRKIGRNSKVASRSINFSFEVRDPAVCPAPQPRRCPRNQLIQRIPHIARRNIEQKTRDYDGDPPMHGKQIAKGFIHELQSGWPIRFDTSTNAGGSVDNL